jgi:hypothetical protein
VTSQGSPYGRFRRALDSQNATVAYTTATELDFVGLSDALELVLLLVDDHRLRHHHASLPLASSVRPQPFPLASRPLSVPRERSRSGTELALRPAPRPLIRGRSWER